MALTLTGEEFEAIRDDFLAADTNGDGMLSRSEVQEYIHSDHKDKTDLMIRLMDLDRNGVIEFHEFLEVVACIVHRKGISDSKLKQIFKAMDKDGNGLVDADEMILFFDMMHEHILIPHLPSHERIVELINSLDKNSDGKVDFNKFVEAFEDCLD